MQFTRSKCREEEPPALWRPERVAEVFLSLDVRTPLRWLRLKVGVSTSFWILRVYIMVMVDVIWVCVPAFVIRMIFASNQWLAASKVVRRC